MTRPDQPDALARLGRFPPIHPACTRLLHGGDYNPDQWVATPGVWDEDMRLMGLAHCNTMTLGIFAWSALEPQEGRYEFGWLDRAMDNLAGRGAFAVLATPSGGKPAWMSRRYPQVRRVSSEGVREPHRRRHNHCPSSPVYREKCVAINTRLAERYKGHPALVLWHVSNEYNGGDCFCELCWAGFHDFLRKRYEGDIDRLNQAYWSAFWSHTYPDFDYVDTIDRSVHGLVLDWARYRSELAIEFYRVESAPLRAITPEVAVTTNFHGAPDLDYGRFAGEVDVVSWDFYPNWHESGSGSGDGSGDDVGEAIQTAFMHDRCRSYRGGQPWVLMESVPSIPTRAHVKKRKEPGMQVLSSLQPVAHGSDTVLYFQWRKGRGGMEKFHGAVVDHEGSERTREFREVAEVGRLLERLDAVVGTSVSPRVAVVQDWENEVALREGARVYLGENVKYGRECVAHYGPFWRRGVPVDVIDQTRGLEGYALVVAPMAYLLRPGFAQRLRGFVAGGGTAVMTYWSAVVDESDLCYLGGVPGAGLREVFGVWEEESQSYFAHESVAVEAVAGNALGLAGVYRAVDTCSVVHAESATVLARFGDQYFAGSPALTVNAYGKGRAYYLAARMGGDFLGAFYGAIAEGLGLERALDAELPSGVTAQVRTDGRSRHVFVMNFNRGPATVELGGGHGLVDALTGEAVGGTLALERYGVRVLRRRGSGGG